MYYTSTIIIVFITIFLSQCCQTAKIFKRQNYNGLIDLKCVDSETQREYYIGEAFYRPGKCVRVQCLGNLQLWEDGCSVPKLNGDCTELPVPDDNKLIYPKCCPKYECNRVLDYGNFQEKRVYDHYGNLISSSITQLFVITTP